MHLNLINLKVQDWDRMVLWYQDVLGLTAVYLEPHDKYGQLDAGDVRLSLHSGGVLAEAGVSRLSLQFQVENLLQEIERLESLGCVFFDKQLATGEAYRMAQFRDPEGNAITIYELL